MPERLIRAARSVARPPPPMRRRRHSYRRREPSCADEPPPRRGSALVRSKRRGPRAAGAASVAENCRRDARRLTVAGGERQDSAQRKIVEVVTRDLRERTVLPPTGHAAIDQSRIALGAF